MSNDTETTPGRPEFDFDAHPPDTFFHERRTDRDRRLHQPSSVPAPKLLGIAPAERRKKVERRRRIDPTTFEKQYTEDELEFMAAMQRFKVQSGKAFPTYGEVLLVARSLGYEKAVAIADLPVPEATATVGA